MTDLRALSPGEIGTLESAGCTADDWSNVRVGGDFRAAGVRAAHFAGRIEIAGAVSIRSAAVENCSLANGVAIHNVAGRIANYDIAEGARIVGVGRMVTNPGATFGNGAEVEVVNEGGGRVVRLYDGLSSQTAYLQAMYRYRSALQERLGALIDSYVDSVRSDRGTVGRHAVVESVATIGDVRIGAHARVVGAARLENGTILSEEAAPAFVGANVVAESFIVAEGAKVDSGAMIDKTFVGQAVKLGKTFSAENSLFFCNCEGFHSEAVAVFAGPYTVTHHRATLLIAGTYSFYNAGSATNASNHMYKLGPVHQGTLERGSKTASGSYMLWPCVVGPFTVVMGKNMANFDTSEFPFSYISIEAGGSVLTPGMNMFTVGTTRDGEKWPARDRRKATEKRDLVRFEVFSPFTAGRMMAGERILNALSASTEKSVKVVRHKGIAIKRLLLRTCAKNYAGGIDRYLFGEILRRADAGSLAADPKGELCREWVDVAGLLVGKSRLESILAAVESGAIASTADLQRALAEACDAYESDAWAWVRDAYRERHGKSVDDLAADDIAEMRTGHRKMTETFVRKLLADAEKEFDEGAQLGFGADGDDDDRVADFESVRGTFEGNSFVKGLKKQLDAIGG